MALPAALIVLVSLSGCAALRSPPARELIKEDIHINGEAKSGTTLLETIGKLIIRSACSNDPDCKLHETWGVGRHLVMETATRNVSFFPNHQKHIIPSTSHHNNLERRRPPDAADIPKDEADLASRVAQQLATTEPWIRWMVIFRDPRSVVISSCYHDYEGCPDRDNFALKHVNYTTPWINLRWRYWRAVERVAPSRVKILFFEDLKESPREEEAGIASWLGMQLSTKQMDDLYTNTTVEAMRNASDNLVPGDLAKTGKVRDGAMCNYRKELSQDVAEAMSEQMRTMLEPELNQKWSC